MYELVPIVWKCLRNGIPGSICCYLIALVGSRSGIGGTYRIYLEYSPGFRNRSRRCCIRFIHFEPACKNGIGDGGGRRIRIDRITLIRCIICICRPGNLMDRIGSVWKTYRCVA